MTTKEIRADGMWRFVCTGNDGRGMVHALRLSGDDGYKLWCGRYGVPLSFEPGQLVNACLECLNAYEGFVRDMGGS